MRWRCVWWWRFVANEGVWNGALASPDVDFGSNVTFRARRCSLREVAGDKE